MRLLQWVVRTLAARSAPAATVPVHIRGIGRLAVDARIAPVLTWIGDRVGTLINDWSFQRDTQDDRRPYVEFASDGSAAVAVLRPVEAFARLTEVVVDGVTYDDARLVPVVTARYLPAVGVAYRVTWPSPAALARFVQFLADPPPAPAPTTIEEFMADEG